MILVDTSIWVDHLRVGDRTLVRLLGRAQVLAHPWVTGEIALGQLADRDNVLGLVGNLPQAQVATDRELARFISEQRLYGLGIGYVDAQLLAATRLTPTAQLWTRDRRLAAVADRLGASVDPTAPTDTDA
jgi:predicted nucleic acid-binding protein